MWATIGNHRDDAYSPFHVDGWAFLEHPNDRTRYLRVRILREFGDVDCLGRVLLLIWCFVLYVLCDKEGTVLVCCRLPRISLQRSTGP